MITPKPACYLRATTIELRDGSSVTLRAMPFRAANIGLVRRVLAMSMEDGDDDAAGHDLLEIAQSVASLVEQSLAHDQSPERVEEVLNSGMIDMSDKSVMPKVLNALMAGVAPES